METDVYAIDVGEICDPNTVARREVVECLEIEIVGNRHAPRADVIREEVEKRATSRNNPRPLAFPKGAFEDEARSGEAHGGSTLELLAIPFA